MANKEKQEMVKEFQRQMILKGYSVLDIYEISKVVKLKFNVKFDLETKEEIIEKARKEFCE